MAATAVVLTSINLQEQKDYRDGSSSPGTIQKIMFRMAGIEGPASGAANVVVWGIIGDADLLAAEAPDPTTAGLDPQTASYLFIENILVAQDAKLAANGAPFFDIVFDGQRRLADNERLFILAKQDSASASNISSFRASLWWMEL